ncbi:MAG: leucine-rich repeat domain-containing protein [Prevotella sp.]|nr:leucine-rich repeat domain-containing protein [Prevotella sp.]
MLNYESNCATSDFNVTPTVSGGSDGVPYSVNINVVPYLPGDEAMDCICPYYVSFTVRDVEANSFYLSCWWYEGEVTLEEGKPLVLEDIWEEVTIDGMKYTLRKAMGRAMLVDGSTQKGEVRIPSELSYEGKDYTVTSIGESAFTENMNLTKVFIPRTIMNTDLSYNVGFYSDPFYGCTALQSIEVEDGNPAVCSVDGVLFNKEKTKLLSYPAGATQTSYTVPESVTWIEPLAFSYSQHLRVVTLTDYVTELGYSAFYECKSLEEVRLPSGLKTLANYLFGNCQRLKSVTIPQGVTYLGLKAFYCCTSLTSVTMPESITSTDYSVFEGCTSLESVTLSPNLSKI